MSRKERFTQDVHKIYDMISPSERNDIIEKINNHILIPETRSVREKNMWKIKHKHHPDQDIPTNIYLLGKGTIDELKSKYIKKYGNIKNINHMYRFKDFTREMIKQKIMI